MEMNPQCSFQLDEEFRYLQRKKNVVKEFSEIRLKVFYFLLQSLQFMLLIYRNTHLLTS